MKKDYDFKAAKRGAVLARKGKSRITIWLDDAKLGPGIEYGNWSPYIPREPNI